MFITQCVINLYSLFHDAHVLTLIEYQLELEILADWALMEGVYCPLLGIELMTLNHV